MNSIFKLATIFTAVLLIGACKEIPNQFSGGPGPTRIEGVMDYDRSQFWQQPMGGESSGGDPGVVCRDSSRRIVSVEPLDRYEGRVRFGQLPGDWDSMGLEGALDVMVDRASRANEPFRYDLEDLIAIVRANISFLPEGVGLYPGVDLGGEYAVVVPDGCGLELIGYYESSGKITVAKSLYDQLRPTQQAAFILHEAVYKMARMVHQAENSASSRQLVAEFFAQASTFESLKSKIAPIYFGSHFQPLIFDDLENAKLTVHIDHPTRPSYSYSHSVEAYCFDLAHSRSGDALSRAEFDVTSDTFDMEMPVKNCPILSAEVNVGGWTPGRPMSLFAKVSLADKVIFSDLIDTEKQPVFFGKYLIYQRRPSRAPKAE